MTITADFERFYYFAFEASFLENGNFTKKLEYLFLVQSITICTQNGAGKSQCYDK